MIQKVADREYNKVGIIHMRRDFQYFHVEINNAIYVYTCVLCIL